MQEIERKASSPGEPLTQAEVTEWYEDLIELSWLAGKRWTPNDIEGFRERNAPSIEFNRIKAAHTPPDYAAANRYLDSTGYKGHG